MALKPTPISQDIILNLTAKADKIEANVKDTIKKLQSSTLSDAYIKPYLNSLQKVLEKNQEIRKVISETNSGSSKSVSDLAAVYNSLGSELTRIIAKIENHPVNFKDVVVTGDAETEFKRLNTVLKQFQTIQDEIYSKAAKATPLKIDKEIDQKGQINKDVLANLNNEEKVTKLIDEQINKANTRLTIGTQEVENTKKQIDYYERLVALTNKFTAKDQNGAYSINVRDDPAGIAARDEALKQFGVGGSSTDIRQGLEAKLKSIDKSTLDQQLTKQTADLAKFSTQLKDLLTYKTEILKLAKELGVAFEKAAAPIVKAKEALDAFKKSATSNAKTTEIKGIVESAENSKTTVGALNAELKTTASALQDTETTNSIFSNLQSKITQIFGLANAFQILRRFIEASWNSIKELDAAFTKIAVVTDMSAAELWNSFDEYNQMAQQLGVTTTDAIETSALYYQQGLNTADVMTLTTETIKMAQIANMDFSESTAAMTAAIRGFKLSMQDASDVTDIYSALAAKAAVDTEDIATAISKTASIAGSAGMALETTSAFLTQIIETTQEAPETAGTALKTIIARFTELKKNPVILTVDVEGEEVSANKIEAALKTVDVALRDHQGEFRNLDDVFLEVSKSWDSLTRNQQRYVATTAAGLEKSWVCLNSFKCGDFLKIA